ncbi:hypothetical protein HPB50_010358 [Hyalomma asiaticum]|uniref:Uncharacterized protein n=1 Tax=Hyalomma asiaticum TaxID=266040 RepID=A0ACB7TLZ6_HYAAI|nr:hypothetical protein HPB50_010358 [Hyalomma asiaticum]
MEIQDVRTLTENGILADASALLAEASSGDAAVATLPVVNLSIPFLGGTQGIMIGTTQDGSGAFVVDASQLSLLSSSGVFADGVLQLSVQGNDDTEQLVVLQPQEMASLESSGTAPLMELSTNVPASMPLITLSDADTAKKLPAVHKVEEIGPPLGKGPFKCSVCNMEFTKWSQLQRHERAHAEDKPFKCSRCDASFNQELNLRLHMATHPVNPSTMSVVLPAGLKLGTFEQQDELNVWIIAESSDVSLPLPDYLAKLQHMINKSLSSLEQDSLPELLTRGAAL